MHPEFQPMQKVCAGRGYGEGTAFVSSSGGASCSCSGSDDLDGVADGASRRYMEGGRCEPPGLGIEDSMSRAQRRHHACYATENTNGDKFGHGGCSGHHARFRWGSGDARMKCREHFVDIIADVSPGQRPQEAYNKRSAFGMGNSSMNPMARCANHAEAGVFNVGDARCLNGGCNNYMTDGRDGAFHGQHIPDGSMSVASKNCLHEDCGKRTRFDLEGRISGVRVRRSGPNSSLGFMECGVGWAGTNVHSMADGRCLHEGCSLGAENSKFRICCKEFAQSHAAVGGDVVGDGFCAHEGCQLGPAGCKFRLCCRQVSRRYMASFGDGGCARECGDDPAEDATENALDRRYAAVSCDRHNLGWDVANTAGSANVLGGGVGTGNAQFVVAKTEYGEPASDATAGGCHYGRDRVVSTSGGRDTRRVLPGLPRAGAEDDDGEMERPLWIKMETDISM